jgi:nucleoside-diphosphate-sugar epimerase
MGHQPGVLTLPTQKARKAGPVRSTVRRWDTAKPDGTQRKLLDVGTLRNSGWRPNYSLIGGIVETVSWYRSSQPSLRS